jgi:hypothetical protein
MVFSAYLNRKYILALNAHKILLHFKHFDSACTDNSACETKTSKTQLVSYTEVFSHYLLQRENYQYQHFWVKFLLLAPDKLAIP